MFSCSWFSFFPFSIRCFEDGEKNSRIVVSFGRGGDLCCVFSDSSRILGGLFDLGWVAFKYFGNQIIDLEVFLCPAVFWCFVVFPGVNYETGAGRTEKKKFVASKIPEKDHKKKRKRSS